MSEPVNTYARDQRQIIYFVQADELRLIKIGMAANPDKRIRDLANVSPDSLTVLGLQICDDWGSLEAVLHERFSAERVRGEWFLPVDDLLDHINSYATSNTKALARLNAIAKFPLMKRGRPTREMKEEMRLVGLDKWR